MVPPGFPGFQLVCGPLGVLVVRNTIQELRIDPTSYGHFGRENDDCHEITIKIHSNHHENHDSKYHEIILHPEIILKIWLNP